MNRNALFVFALIFILFNPGFAIILRSDDETTVAADEIIDDDVFIFGEDIVVKGMVNGDLVAFGSKVEIDGIVNGTIVAGGSNVAISAIGVRSIWAGGSNIDISAEVQNNVVIFGGTLKVTEDAVIGKELKGFGGSLHVHGDVGGSIDAGAGTFEFSGTSDDLTVNADDITIRESAHIYGDLTVKSEKPADIESGAIVTGEIIYQKVDTDDEDAKEFFAFAPLLAFFVTMWKILCFVAKLIVGIVIIAVSQRFVRRVVNSLTKMPWISLLVGFLALIVIPIAIVIILMLVIGFPLAVFGGFFYTAIWYLSAIFVSCFAGEKVIQLFKKEGTISLYPSFILGFVLIALIGLIPIIGFVLKLSVLLFGVGMLLIGLWTLMKDMKEKELL
jgi:hypothetical protein